MTRPLLLTLAALAAALVLAPAAQAAFQLQTAWGTFGSGSGQFSGPLLIDSGPDGSVYVADAGNNRIQKFTADGAFLTTWGSTGSGNGQFNLPDAVASGPDGTVYVADTANNRIQHFDANGTFLSTFGTPGSLDGQFNTPTAVAVAPDGSVYVTDSGNTRVERFLADGTFLATFATGVGDQLQAIAVGPDGSVYVTDANGSRVEHFDANGVSLGNWGSNGAGDGQFQQPRGIAANSQGVYVVDNQQSRVQKFTSTGAFLDSLDATSAGDPALSGPFGIAISSIGQIYVSQNSAGRIARYGETTNGSNLPPPTTGQTANADPQSGTVKVKKPGSNQFQLLASGQQIPIGSIVDVTNGTVSLTTTASDTATQTAVFFAGVFQLLQDKTKNPVTELRLFGSNFAKACGTPGKASISAGRKKKVVRQLWGVGTGKFRTKGRYASASIRGTQWLTQDRCDGTLVRVKQGSVTVRDLVKKKNVIVKAPKSYLALAKP